MSELGENKELLVRVDERLRILIDEVADLKKHYVSRQEISAIITPMQRYQWISISAAAGALVKAFMT